MYWAVELCCVVYWSAERCVCVPSPSQQVGGIALLVHVHHPQLVSCAQTTKSRTATQPQTHKHLHSNNQKGYYLTCTWIYCFLNWMCKLNKPNPHLTTAVSTLIGRGRGLYRHCQLRNNKPVCSWLAIFFVLLNICEATLANVLEVVSYLFIFGVTWRSRYEAVN